MKNNDSETNTYSLVIIGGGPAGLFCAVQAADAGRNVLVLEKNPTCGRKLLISGSGQCNLTHGGDIRSFLSHYGDNGQFLKPSLMNFKNTDLISFFSDRKLLLVTEIGGKVFPDTRKATDILAILLQECSAREVAIHCNEPVTSISKTGEQFRISTKIREYQADCVVIATGGVTYPVTGSTGDGFTFAKSLGHRITPVRPALTSVVIQDYQFSDLSGISFADIIISLFRDGRKIRQHVGDLLFTHTGLSGPGILDFSRFILPGDILKVSFIPGADPIAVKETMINRIASSGNRQVRTVLAEFDLPERMIKKILEIAGIEQTLTGAHLTKQNRAVLIDLMTACPFPVSRLGGPEEAMVTCGGVTLSEVNPKTMESRLVPGLFFAGEVLDIDGDTGGYNLQAAFSTAMLAAKRVTGYPGSQK